MFTQAKEFIKWIKEDMPDMNTSERLMLFFVMILVACGIATILSSVGVIFYMFPKGTTVVALVLYLLWRLYNKFIDGGHNA